MPARLIEDPARWLARGLGGVAAFLAALTIDPTGVVATVALTVIEQADTLFTVTSIFGFTVAPEVPQLEPWVPWIQRAALVTGTIFALSLIDRFWDNLTEDIE